MKKTFEQIKSKLEQIIKEKFTGQIVVRLFFNQGGIRDYSVAREKEL